MGKFKDKRLDKRASKLSALLVAGRSSSIHSITSNESERKAAYRFLNNGKTEEQTLTIATASEKFQQMRNLDFRGSRLVN